MIKITALDKIYRSKKRSKCKALDNINLTFGDTGLVFVLGKSGSGKSTLLNLIGGLDNITHGKIEVDGNDLSKFKENDFCNYRNTHVGFIFQDYHLIDELTVYENIIFSLNLRKIEDRERVLNALKVVDLDGYAERYPTELSGGEQQRIAIARAIVKNPRIILADEPTGNLDTNTATSIINLLKSLSRECLIIIVSHNINDANKYADRIIELKKGQVISDKSRNPCFADKAVLENGELYYPYDKTLDDEDVEIINEGLKTGRMSKFVRQFDKFIPTPPQEIESKNVELNKTTLPFKKEIKFSALFLKNKVFSIALSSFMVAAIMIIMALAQTIIAFDGNDIISEEMIESDFAGILVQKATTEADRMLYGNSQRYFKHVTQGDINAFRKAGYEGDIYELNSYELCLHSSAVQGFAGIYPTYLQQSLYIKSTLGTLKVDEEFLRQKFGTLEYVARVDKFDPAGVIITDYVADSILKYNEAYRGLSYEDLLGEYSYNSYVRGYINGIIKTDYAQKYKGLFDDFYSGNYEKFSELRTDERFLNFSDAVYEKYGYCFSLNENFEKSFIENEHLDVIYHHQLTFNGVPYINSQYIIMDEDTLQSYPNLADIDLAPNEVVMNISTYNKIFGTDLKYPEGIHDFEPHTVKLAYYYRDDYKLENCAFEQEIVIKKVTTHATYTFIASDELYEKFQELSMFSKGLYFDSNKNIGAVISTADKLDFTTTTMLVQGIYTMTRAVEVFIPIFEIVAVVLCLAVVFVLINFSSKMINDKMHEIGIMKALGAKNKSIIVIFGLQVLLIAVLTCIMSTIGYYAVIGLANDVLVDSLKELATGSGHVVPELEFLIFKGNVAIVNCLLVFFLSFVSMIAPIVKIKAIKPVKIIKSKE